jgi:hypothetical protein
MDIDTISGRKKAIEFAVKTELMVLRIILVCMHS